MSHVFLSGWPERLSRFQSRGRLGEGLAARRRLRATLAIELLEDRTLLSVVSFAPSAYAVPDNRPDSPLGLNTFLPVEPVISISDRDPGQLVVSSQDSLSVSPNDGGVMMSTTDFPVVPSGGNSTTVYDKAGRLFWVNLNRTTRGISIVQVNPGTGDIIGGPFNVTTNASANATVRDDRPFIAADLNNSNLFVAWTRFESNGTTSVYVSRSTNQGSTWSTPTKVSAAEGFVWPATVSVGPGESEEVFVAYHSQTGFLAAGIDGVGNPDGTSGKVFVARYTNDLSILLSKTLAFSTGLADVTFNVQSAARTIPGTQFWTQGSAQPWVLADPSRPDHVYVVAADDPTNGGVGDRADVVIARSTNNGASWTTSTIDAGPAGSVQLFPTAAIDRFGNIAVAWYDNRRGLKNAGTDGIPGNGDDRFLLDVFARYSTDGGLSWSPAIMVNDAANPFDPDAGAPVRFSGPPATTWIGDHIGVALFGGTAYAAWNGNTFSGVTPAGQQVWFDAFALRGALTIDGDEAGPTNDTIILRSQAEHEEFTEVLLNGQRQYAGLWSALTPGVTLNGNAMNDTVNVENTVAGVPVAVNLGSGLDTAAISPVANDVSNIQGTVTVNGGDDLDTLVVNDQQNHDNQNYVMTATTVARSGSAVIAYDLVGNDESVVVNGGTGDNTYDVNGTADIFQTTLNHGRGTDVVDVRATTGRLNVVGSSLLGVFSTVNVGNAGSVQAIAGIVTVTNSPGLTTLNVDDSADSTAQAVFVDHFGITGLAPAEIRYSQGNLIALNIFSGTGGNTFTFLNTPAVATPGFSTLVCGSGADVVNVLRTGGALDLVGPGQVNLSSAIPGLGLQEIRGRVTVFGNGLTTLSADASDDPNSRTVALNADVLTGLAAADIRYVNLAVLAVQGGGTGANTFNVQSTPLGTSVFVNSGPGDDTINVTSVTSALDSMAGALTVNGQGGTNVLNVNDSGTVTAQAYSVTAAVVARLGGPAIAFGAVQRVTLTGGGGGNAVAVTSTLAGAITTVNAGSGVNAVVVGAGTLAGIDGTLIVNGGNALSGIVINDLAGGVAAVLTGTVFARVGAAPIFYATARTLTIDAGGDVAVEGTAGGVTTILNALAGAAVTVGNTLSGAQEVRGLLDLGGGPIVLEVDDSFDLVGRTAVLTTTSLTGLASSAISFAPGTVGVLTMIGARNPLAPLAPNNTFNVQGTPAGAVLVTIDAGPGDDVINVGSPTNTINSVTAALTIDGGLGSDVLNINDQGNLPLTGRTYTITPTTVTRAGDPIATGVITYMSIRTLTVNGSSSYAVTDTAADTATILNAGTASDTITVRFTSGPLTVNAGAGDDSITLGPTNDLTGIRAVTVDGGAGADTLTLSDSAFAAFPETYTVTSSAVTLAVRPSFMASYSAVENLTLNASNQGNNTINIISTASGVSTKVNSGAGADAVNVRGTTGGLTIDGQAGANTVIIGSTAPALGGTVSTINGAVSVSSAGGTAALTVDDSGAAVARNATLAGNLLAGNLTGLASAAINFVPNDLLSLTIHGGTGGNTFTVTNTPVKLLVDIVTTINTGSAGDTVHVRGTTGSLVVNTQNGDDLVNVGNVTNSINEIAGAVTINGGPGNNVLNVNDQGNPVNPARVYTITATTVRRTGDLIVPGTITYANITVLTVNGSSSYIVAGTAPGSANLIRGGADIDIFTILGLGAGSTLAVDGGSRYDLIELRTGVSTDVFEFVNVEAVDVEVGGVLTVFEELDIHDLILSGGTINGLGTLAVADEFFWLAGTMDGPGKTSMLPGSTLVIIGGPADAINRRRLDNAGLVTWDGVAAGLGGDAATPINNLRDGVISGSGQLTGAVLNDGEVDPGGLIDPGTIRVVGTFRQTANGVLNVKIGGSPADPFDRVTVTGAATVAGTLNIALIDGLPVVDDAFPIVVSAAARIGRFATINGTGIRDRDFDGTDDVFFVAHYNPADVTLVVTDPDRVAPQRPTLDLVDVFDTGSSNLDNVTLLVGLDFEVCAETTSTVVIKNGVLEVDQFMILLGTCTIRTLSVAAGQLFEGPNPLSAESTDAAGNRSQQSEQLLVTIDTMKPPAPSVPDLLFNSDSGFSQIDDVTNIQAAAFKGTGEANALIRLLDRFSTFFLPSIEIVGQGLIGSDQSGTAPNDAVGVWEVTVEPLIDRAPGFLATPHLICAEAEDLAGNVSLLSDCLAVTIDTLPPQRPTLDLLNGFDTGRSDADNVTRLTSLTFSVCADTGTAVLIKNGDTVIDSFSAGAICDLRVLTAAGGQLIEGPNLLRAESFDAAGNRSAQSEQLLVTLDTTPPAAPTIVLSPTSDSRALDGITNINAPAFLGMGEANSLVRVVAGLFVEVGSGDVGSFGFWEVTIEPQIDGQQAYQAILEDLAGNFSAPSVPLAVTIDTLPPQRPTIDLLAAFDSGRSNLDNVTRLTSLNFEVCAELGTQVVVKNGVFVVTSFAQLLPFCTIRTLTQAFLFSQLFEGGNPLSVETTDVAGNRSDQSEELLVILDTIAPASPTLDLQSASDSGMFNNDDVTNNNALSVVGSGESNAAIFVLSDAFNFVGQGFVTSSSVWEVTLEPLADNAYALAAVQEDLAGNLSNPSALLAVVIDTLEPDVPYLDLLDASDSGNKFDNVTFINPQTMSVTAGDAVRDDGVAHAVKYRLFDRDGAAPETLLRSTLFGAPGVFPEILTLGLGTHNLKLEVEDRAGNVSHAFLLQVIIINPPGQNSAVASLTSSSRIPMISAGRIDRRGQRDSVEFAASETGRVTIDVTTPGSPLDANLAVFDSRHRRIGRNGDFARGVKDSHVEVNVVAGRTYSIQVSGARRTTGLYELAVDYVLDTPDDHGDTSESASALVVGTSGGLANGTIGRAGDVDLFRLTPQTSGRLVIGVGPSPSFLDPNVRVLDAAGELLMQNYDATTDSAAGRVAIDVVAGSTYFVRVAGPAGRRGDYELALDWIL